MCQVVSNTIKKVWREKDPKNKRDWKAKFHQENFWKILTSTVLFADQVLIVLPDKIALLQVQEVPQL